MMRFTFIEACYKSAMSYKVEGNFVGACHHWWFENAWIYNDHHDDVLVIFGCSLLHALKPLNPLHY